jgi:predicted DNA-binding transcriptional regulator YafY
LGAYCLERNQKRVFNVDRILEISIAPNESKG